MQSHLVLAHEGDSTAVRVANALRQLPGSPSVVQVTPEELALAPRWAHALEDSSVRTAVRLRCGTELVCDEILSVFHRVRSLPAPQLALGSAVDREYAAMELSALFVSWLASLRCPVVNPPLPGGSAEPSRASIVWHHRARLAGLPCRELLVSTSRCHSQHAENPLAVGRTHDRSAPPQLDTRRGPEWFASAVLDGMARILVVGDRTLGDAPGNLSPAALRLARNSGLDLLELRFQRPADGSTEWVFVDAVTMPELESAGEIEAVAMHLARSEREVQSRAAVEHLGAHA